MAASDRALLTGGKCSRRCLVRLSGLRQPWVRPRRVERGCTRGSGLPLGRVEFQVSRLSQERQGMHYLCSSEPSRTRGSGDVCSLGVSSPCGSHGLAGRREDEKETKRFPWRTERSAFPTQERFAQLTLQKLTFPGPSLRLPSCSPPRGP